MKSEAASTGPSTAARFLVLCLAGLLAACGQPETGAGGASADDAPRVPEAVVPEPAVAKAPWPADAALHAGMARIARATEALGHSEHGHLDAAQVTALADELDAATAAIIAQCKLEPAADEALHVLLVRVLAASRALRAAPADPAPIADLREVLRLYPQTFSDPEWKIGAEG